MTSPEVRLVLPTQHLPDLSNLDIIVLLLKVLNSNVFLISYTTNVSYP